jgi:beta-fructofuranosidase
MVLEVGEFREVFDPAQGETEPWCINDHCFIYGPDRLWHVYGITHVFPFEFYKDPGRNLLHATAPSLYGPWTKQAPALVADYERFGELLLWAPHVVPFEGGYRMFVCAGSPDHEAYRIHSNTSQDLWHWERDPWNPLVCDGFDARDPMVLRDGDRWILYYTANSTPSGGNHVVKAMVSNDLRSWSAPLVVFTHPRVGDFAGPTESPFVVQRSGVYYLFVCDADVIHIYESSDPLAWRFEDHVGEVAAHAAEIVQDLDGSWHISHAGWGNGGLSLARLKWTDGFDPRPS